MRFIIGVGSNKGDRAFHISTAADLLTQNNSVEILNQAPFYENPAQGGPLGQEPFINTAWMIETKLGPHQILHRLQHIERKLGRIRTVIHGARSIDLDLLLADCTMQIENAVLSLPHPRMQDRDFVMIPVAEIAPDWMHPILNRSMAQLRDQLMSANNA